MKTGRGADQFMLRLPDGMRDQLKADALVNDRSMNAEIVARLSGDQRSLRDWFAGQALAGLLTSMPPPSFHDEKRNLDFSMVALAAYELADAMIVERSGDGLR